MEKNRMIGNDIRLIHNLIGAYCERRRMESKDDVPAMQGRTLGYLICHKLQIIYQKDLEQEFHISRATATKMLQSMEKKGLIIRQAVESDGRLKQILPTEQGISYHRRIREDFKRLEEILVEGMSEKEADLLSTLLGRARHNLEQERKQADSRK